jgi:alkyldihydroxyacetonephosphate synthase
LLCLCRLPPVQKYGSLIFPNLEAGVSFMREVASQRAAPSSIRLVDNEQFQFGLALKPDQKNPFKPYIDGFKKLYVTKWHGFDPYEMCVATVMFEGSAAEVAAQRTKIFGIASRFRGLDAGEENGHRGYFLTFMIAYLRDFGMNYHFIAESFETSVPWSNVLVVCEKVKLKVVASCKEHGVTTAPFVSCRVTQTYDTGACVYFYFGFSWKGLSDPVGVFTQVEDETREEILALGGSLSHHHGIGKHRQKWLPSQISNAGVSVLCGVKRALDPKNILGNGNLVRCAPVCSSLLVRCPLPCAPRLYLLPRAHSLFGILA